MTYWHRQHSTTLSAVVSSRGALTLGIKNDGQSRRFLKPIGAVDLTTHLIQQTPIKVFYLLVL